MLAASVINSNASLNSFYEIGSLDFIAGETTTLAIRLRQPQDPNGLRYVPSAVATMSVNLPNKDGTTLTKAMTVIDSGDRSMWKVSLTALETADLANGNFTFTLTDGAEVQTGFVQLGLSLVITGAC